jgi:hypothetical protein
MKVVITVDSRDGVLSHASAEVVLDAMLGALNYYEQEK